MLNKSKTEIFITKGIKKHGNCYDYSKVNYIDAETPVTIICKEHGEFLQKPKNHIRGFRCRKCANTVRPRSSTEEFIGKSISKFKTKYSYINTHYTTHRDEIIITCKKHGDFKITPRNHLSSAHGGCKECANDITTSSTRDTSITFAIKANKLYQGVYDYSKVKYVNSLIKVEIICRIHGPFMQPPNSHLAGHGCPYCKGVGRKTTEQFIKDSNYLFKNIYDYSKTLVIGVNKKVTIICAEHGDFYKTPIKHLAGQGCPHCAKSGYKVNLPATFYLIKLPNSVLGFGISNSFDDRYRTHRKNFKKHKTNHELLQTFNCTGHQALAIETHLKQTYEIIDTGIEGFRKEATEIKHLPDILKYIKKLLDTI